ncbi:trypsin-like peptidase domain-containing protein, partial [Mesorhizobium japonicum]|uniref:trypsin-like peptidase domain-containing protein n=1 Tax=Mesorhizobium japonicum TaxID=2066070 RepID=UPI003B5ABB06
PSGDTGTAVLQRAAQSVVRISGTAYACGQNQSGSGFVVARNRIVTNAHVVAGVEHPVVEAPNGQAIESRIVYFDSSHDIAVLEADGLAAAPLAMGSDLGVGAA